MTCQTNSGAYDWSNKQRLRLVKQTALAIGQTNSGAYDWTFEQRDLLSRSAKRYQVAATVANL